MKKVFDIALKDMIQSFRSYTALVFMFAVPILMTGMFYLMFGGLGGTEDDFTLPSTKVQVVNLDQGQFPTEFSGDTSTANVRSLGEVLLLTFSSEELTDLFKVSETDDPAAARKGVDDQDFGAAVIIPENFTDAMIDPTSTATLEVYQDPTLTLGPTILKSILSQFLDNFSSSKITMAVTLEQLQQSGVTIDQNLIQSIVTQFYGQLEGQESDASVSQASAYEAAVFMDIRTPEGKQVGNENEGIIALMMAGMIVFYVFFTGASSGQSILTEEEKGTLPRLFTTPTQQTTLFAGKILAIVMTIIVQITVLLLFGNLIFGINWGDPLGIVLISTGMVIAAGAFGIFLISWAKTVRQAGFAIGGLVTLTGMMGMLPVFIAGVPNPPEFVDTISKLVPQGWAIHGYQLIMEGGNSSQIISPLLILLAWSVALFIIGVLRFRNRYA